MNPPAVRIVLAEPDPVHRSHFENIVAHSRYLVARMASDAAGARAACLEERPEVLVLDAVLSSDGAVADFKKSLPALRIVLAFDPVRADRVLPALAAGALDAMRKPFHSSEVFDALSYAADLPAAPFSASQRQAGRVRVEIPVEFQAGNSRLFARTATGKTGDLSDGGICLVTDHELEPGEKVRLKIALGDGAGELRLKARVANRREGPGGRARYGLEFQDLDPRTRGRIEQFLLERLSGITGYQRREENP